MIETVSYFKLATELTATASEGLRSLASHNSTLARLRERGLQFKV